MPCVEWIVWEEVRKFLQWFKPFDGGLGVEGDGRKGRHIGDTHDRMCDEG